MNVKNSSWCLRTAPATQSQELRGTGTIGARKTGPLTARHRSRRAMAWHFAEANEVSATRRLRCEVGGGFFLRAGRGQVAAPETGALLCKAACGLPPWGRPILCCGTGRHLGGIWVGTWRTGNEFRPGWFAQMPPYAALYLLVPPFFRKFYRGCLRTATMRTVTVHKVITGRGAGKGHAFVPLCIGFERLGTAWIGFFGAYICFWSISTNAAALRKRSFWLGARSHLTNMRGGANTRKDA
jgi:hypothetical protein